MSKELKDPLSDLRKIDLPFDVDSVIEQCHDCVRKQLKKYEKSLDSYDKVVGQRFLVPCTGIPINSVDPELRSIFPTKEQFEILEEANDITKWAAANLKLPNGDPWIARYYQSEVLKCSSRRKSLRISRRTGKCIGARSNIIIETGKIKPNNLIEDIKTTGNKPKIATFNQETQTIELTSKYKIWNNGKKPTYKILTVTGRETYITENHPFLLIDNNTGKFIWKELKDINIGDKIAVPNSYEEILSNNNRIDIGDRESRLLGYLIGDGGTHYDFIVRFANISNILIDDFEDIVSDYNCELTKLSPCNYQVVSKCKDRTIKYRNAVNKLVTSYDIRQKSIHKFVPKDIFKSKISNICNFLAAYWDCDGWASVSNKTHKGRKSCSIEVGACTSSKDLADDIHYLLLLVGISSILNKKKVLYKGEYRYAWQITIADNKNIQKFSERIPLRLKQKDLNDILKVLEIKDSKSFGKSTKDLIPKSIYKYIETKRLELNLSRRKVGKNKEEYYSYTPEYSMSKDKLSIFSKNLNNDSYLEKLCNSSIQWDKIISIENIGEEETYDLSVEGTHSLISDNIISHNTDLVCIEICYYLFTEPGIKIVVAGPQKTHTEEIVTRVRAFIANNPILKRMVKRDVSAPYYEIKISHGKSGISRLRGFAAGTKGKGQSGVGIRGQDADRIYCFPKGTLVNTSEFSLKPIEKLTLEDTILGGNKDKIEVGKITNLGIRRSTVMTVPTPLSVIQCTPDHPLFDGENDIKAEDASEVICSLYYQNLSFEPNILLARVLGGIISQAENCKQLIEDKSFLKEDSFNFRNITDKYCSSNYIPNFVKNNNDEIKRSFLSGLLSGFSNRFIVRDKIFNNIKIKDIIPCYHLQSVKMANQNKLIKAGLNLKKITWKDNYVKLPIIKSGIRYSEELVDVYNLTSTASNRFFAGGFFTHNCEEMDYMDETAITGAILPILMTTPDTALVGFSTPSGFKTQYYRICEEDPNYIEFHYTYKVLPHWRNVELERSSFTEEDWTHEFLAGWGESESGVYKPSYIDAALQVYEYSSIVRIPTWKYCIGIDWNEKHGTEITILGYNTHIGMFKIVDSILVPKSEFTQLSGINKVIELNEKWMPVFIYSDAGNGCLHKDSLIYTVNELKTINDIKIGDKVLSHNGNFKDVTNVISTGSKESYLLRPLYCLSTKASDVHTHIVYRSKDKFNDFNTIDNLKTMSSDLSLQEIQTKDLNKDKDFFIIPKQDISNSRDSYIVDLAKELSDIPNLEYNDKYIWNKYSYSTSPSLSVNQIVEKYKVSRSTVQRTKRKLKKKQDLTIVESNLAKAISKEHGKNWYILENKKTSRYIDILDPDFLCVYGWYLSEGHAGVNNTEICQMPFHYKKEFEKLISICSNRWDCNVLIKKDKMIRLFILDSIFTSFLKKIGGSHCYNKFIDKRIMENNGHQLLPSLFYGDGYEHKHGVNLSLTSLTLTYQVRQMLCNNNILSGIHYVKSRKRKDSYNSAPQLMLYLNAREFNVNKINNILNSKLETRGGVQRRQYIELKNCFLVPIKKIESIGIVEDMYDLTVEGDSSFCANGFATHNSTNNELLMKLSQKEKLKGKNGNRHTARIMDILRAYDSGSALTIKDPITGEDKRVPAKPFMVNASIRMFEQKKIHISSSDTILEKQLRNYIIERYTPNKTPVYGLESESVKDHRLDALNLAIVAFHLEFDDLHVIRFVNHAGPALDPRNNKQEQNKTIEEQSSHGRPEDRRLDNGNQMGAIYQSVFGTSNLQSIKTNRVGVESDTEGTRRSEWLQRKHSRGTVQRDRPKRSNF